VLGEDEDLPEAFICYAHDPVSKPVVDALAALLPAGGVHVVCDRDLARTNVPSMAQWMSRGVRGKIVVVVVSPDLNEWFDNTDGSSEHLGTRYEARYIRRKLYSHTAAGGLPVIVVLPHDMRAEDAPEELQDLQMTRFDHTTGSGIDDIIARIKDADAHARSSASAKQAKIDRVVKNVPTLAKGTSRGARGNASRGRGAGPRPMTTILSDLTDLNPARKDKATQLAREWLGAMRTSGGFHPSDVDRGFTIVARIAREAGDVEMMDEAVELCRAVRPVDDLGAEGKRYLAKLELAWAWVLRSRHRLDEAVDAAELAVELAQEGEDPVLTARALRCLGRVYCGLGEYGSVDARDDHLRKAITLTRQSLDRFQSAGNQFEVGVCQSVLANVFFTRYRTGHDRDDRRTARDLAETASNTVGTTSFREFHELNILRAEIAFSSYQPERARHLLDESFRALKRVSKESCHRELLGRVHMDKAKAQNRNNTADAVANAKTASAIYQALGLPRMIAECEWVLVKLRRRERGFSSGDVRALERLCPDPVERVLIARRGKNWTTWQGFVGWFGDRNWKRRVEEERRRSEP
jgi:hypothetical protein